MDHLMNIDLLLANHVSTFLSSPYKPFLVFLIFVPWAWVVSSLIDKDSRYFHLNTGLWNGINLAAGTAAFFAVLFIPIFWVGWPVAMVLLLTPVLFYWQHRNREVPEQHKFKLSGASIGEKMEARRQARATRDAMIQFVDASGASAAVPRKEDPLYPVHMMAEDLIGPAIDARASMLDITVAQTGATVGQMIDGIMYKRESLPAESALPVVDYLKNLAGLDLEDRRRQQTGTFEMRSPSGSTALTATTAGSSKSLRMRLEFDQATRLDKPFDTLGLLGPQLEALGVLNEMHERHGLILLGAPRNNGLSTSMYSFVARHDAYTSNIKTLEREILVHLDGVDQVLFDPTNPEVDYATALQSMLRRDPDIVMLSIVQDSSTAKAAVEPGLSGPLIYVPQRTNTIGEQVREWVKLVGDVKEATKPLRAVVNQRLLRTLCPNCRQGYQPSDEQLKKLGLHTSKVSTLYRPSGKVQIKNKIENCPVCTGSGYLGQTGIFEVFIVDSEARKLLQGGDLKAALAHARRNKMIYLQEAALSKVTSGETTIEEVIRVTSPPQKKAAKSRPADTAATS